MKKSKIILFALLLSIIGAIGNVSAVNVSISSKSSVLVPSTANQLIQNSSLSKNNIENLKSEKCILWASRIQNFRKGEQIKFLLPCGKYTGKTLNINLVNYGKTIAILTLEDGWDYGVIAFKVDTNSNEIAQAVPKFGSMDFGTIGNSNFNSEYMESNTSKVSIISYSGSSLNQTVDNTKSSKVHCSKINAYSSSIKSNSSLLSLKPSKWTSIASANEGKYHRPGNVIILDSRPIERDSSLINLNHSSSMVKVSSKTSYPSKVRSKSSAFAKSTTGKANGFQKTTTQVNLATFHKFSMAAKKMRRQDFICQSSQKVVDLNGVIHLNPQQVRALKREMCFSNSKAINVVKEMDNAADFHVTHYVSAITSSNSKQNLMMKPQNVTHLDSNVRRVTLPIRGILPATRMDSHTWIYSLVGLAIMIISGKAFFSKKQK